MRPVSGDAVKVMSPVPMNCPPSPGQNFGTGNFVRSMSSPVSTTSFTGALSFAIIAGLIGSAMIERVASIISRVESVGSMPTASAKRSLLAPSMLVRMREPVVSPCMVSNSSAGDLSSRAASSVIAPISSFGSTVAAIRFSSPISIDQRQPFAQVAPAERGRRPSVACRSDCGVVSASMVQSFLRAAGAFTVGSQRARVVGAHQVIGRPRCADNRHTREALTLLRALCRHRIFDQGLAERPDRARDAMAFARSPDRMRSRSRRSRRR